MLVLTRRPTESLIFYTDDGLKITVKVFGIHGVQVRLGIEAPKHVHVDREEIWISKQAEKNRAGP